MKVKDALVVQDEQSKILIGGVVKRTLNGQFGEIFRAYINGVITEEIEDSRIHPDLVDANRKLGRIEGYQKVLLDLETMIEQSDKLQEHDNDEADQQFVSGPHG